MDPIDDQVVALQARIFANRLRLGAVLGRANLHRSSWSRWVKGSQPRRSTLKRVHAAVDELVGEQV